jgi:hypothetical protein
VYTAEILETDPIKNENADMLRLFLGEYHHEKLMKVKPEPYATEYFQGLRPER